MHEHKGVVDNLTQLQATTAELYGRFQGAQVLADMQEALYLANWRRGNFLLDSNALFPKPPELVTTYDARNGYYKASWQQSSAPREVGVLLYGYNQTVRGTIDEPAQWGSRYYASPQSDTMNLVTAVSVVPRVMLTDRVKSLIMERGQRMRLYPYTTAGEHDYYGEVAKDQRYTNKFFLMRFSARTIRQNFDIREPIKYDPVSGPYEVLLPTGKENYTDADAAALIAVREQFLGDAPRIMGDFIDKVASARKYPRTVYA